MKMKSKNKVQNIGQVLKSSMIKASAAAPATAFAMQNMAGASSVVTQINTLSSFVLSIIQAAGVIVTAWGVFEFANGYQSHDGTQQTSGLKRIIAGLIMVGAGTLMSMIGVSV